MRKSSLSPVLPAALSLACVACGADQSEPDECTTDCSETMALEPALAPEREDGAPPTVGAEPVDPTAPESSPAFGCTPASDNCAVSENCVPVSPGEFTCVPEGLSAIGSNCEEANECVSGGLCASTEPEQPQICLQTCGPTKDCPEADQDCFQIQGQNFGVCQTVGTVCELTSDTCGAAETCTLYAAVNNVAEFRCAAAGFIALGGTCDPNNNNCAKGGTCLDVGEGLLCYEGCTVAAEPNECSSATATCNGLQGTTGLCVEVDNECSPVSNPCPAGQVCALRNGGIVCEAEGVAQLGDSCDGTTTCAAPGLCVANVSDGQGTALPATCYEACDPSNPMCTAGQCGTLEGIDFGFCVL